MKLVGCKYPTKWTVEFNNSPIVWEKKGTYPNFDPNNSQSPHLEQLRPRRRPEILQMWFGSNAHVSMCAVHPLEPESEKTQTKQHFMRNTKWMVHQIHLKVIQCVKKLLTNAIFLALRSFSPEVRSSRLIPSAGSERKTRLRRKRSWP